MGLKALATEIQVPWDASVPGNFDLAVWSDILKVLVAEEEDFPLSCEESELVESLL